jgi:hypothetical protein
MTRDEVCAGVNAWFEKNTGIGLDANTFAVYDGVCRHGETLDEVYNFHAGDPVGRMTRQQVDQAWAHLVSMALQMRERQS